MIKTLIGGSLLAVNPAAEMPNPKVLAITAEVWSKILTPIPDDELENSMIMAITLRGERGLTFPVGAPEILQAWKTVHRPEIKSTGEAWSIAVEAVRKTSWGTKPLVCDDPIIAKCIRCIGIAIIGENEKDQARWRFEAMYKEESNAYRERVQIDPHYQLPTPEIKALPAKTEFRDERILAAVSDPPDWRNSREGFRSLLDVLHKSGSAAVLPLVSKRDKEAECYSCQFQRFREVGQGLCYFCHHLDVAPENSSLGAVIAQRPSWCPLTGTAQGC